MATAGYPVTPPNTPQRARARLYADGSVVVQAATPEFGTGVATAMAQVAADALGRARRALPVREGRHRLPPYRRRRRLRRRRHDQRRRAHRRDRPARPAHRPGRRRQHVPAAHRGPGARRRTGRCDDGVRDGARPPSRTRICCGATSSPTRRLRARGTRRRPDTPYGMATFGAQFAEVAVDAGAGADPGAAHDRGLRAGPGAQREDGAQPVDGRHALGPRAGAAGGQPHGRRAPGAGSTPASASIWSRSTRTPRTWTSRSSRSRTGSSIRSGSRASARSGRWVRTPPSPTPSTTRPGRRVPQDAHHRRGHARRLLRSDGARAAPPGRPRACAPPVLQGPGNRIGKPRSARNLRSHQGSFRTNPPTRAYPAYAEDPRLPHLAISLLGSCPNRVRT